MKSGRFLAYSGFGRGGGEISAKDGAPPADFHRLAISYPHEHATEAVAQLSYRAARLKRIYREMVLPGSSVVEDREFRAYWISDKSNSSPARTSEESLPFSSAQQCNS